MVFTRSSLLTGGGSGSGTVTSITAGTGIVCTPDPITNTGVVSLYVAPTAPGVTLVSTPTGIIREYGDNQATVQLDATTVKHTNNITSVLFKRGSATIHTVPTPIAAGGLEQYLETTPVTTATNFTTVVGDGSLTTTSNTISFTFCYPIYYGSDADGLTGADIRTNLTHLIATPATMTRTYSPNANRVYFAYPATSADLSQILDVNNFDVTADFTKTLVNITGLDTSVVSYKVYEIDHNVGSGVATTYRFIF